MALTGTFEELSCAELLQMLNVGHKTGRLTVQQGEQKAVLFISGGEVTRAVSRWERGPGLVYRLLGWKSGEFSFERTDEPVMRNIEESTEALILEGMKRFDEWERVEAEMPDLNVVVRQRAFAVNERFEELSPAAQAVLRLVDARRDVATIIRESGLEPMEALKAVTELLSERIVEEWNTPSPEGDVLVTEGKLPVATGAIDLRSSAYFASGRQLSGRQEAADPEGGEKKDPD
ncbi:MAG: DUF4388 domain-containing protein [Armatimonadota bacterium]|nr:DUF4388 domain-containing protein [Armatimonadota bacterium]